MDPSLGRLLRHGSVGNISSSRLPHHSSRLSVMDDLNGSLKVASLMRAPVGDTTSASMLASTASFHGSGISDLRSAVVAQQRQLDGLIDKVAALLSAMHQEVLQDVREQCQRGIGNNESEAMAAVAAVENRLRAETNAVHEEVQRVAEEAERGFMELREAQGAMRAWVEKVDKEVQSIQDQNASEVRGVHDRIEGEINNVHGHFASEVQTLYQRLASDFRNVDERLDSLEEDGNKAGSSAVCPPPSDHERELQMEMTAINAAQDAAAAEAGAAARELRHELQEELARTVPVLQEQMEELARTIGDSLPKRQAQLEDLHQQLCGQVEHLEAYTRSQRASLDVFEEDQRKLRQNATARLDAMEANASSAEARLECLEQWRRRGEEGPRLEPLRERVSSNEQRLDVLHERLDSLTTCVQQARRGHATEQRLEEFGARLDGLAASLQQESRHASQRTSDLAGRVDATESIVEALQRQQPDPNIAVLEARLSQLQVAAPRQSEDLRKEFEARVAQTQGALQRLADELRHDLETAQQGQSHAQRLHEELRRDLEARIVKDGHTFNRVAEDLRQGIDDMKRDLEVQRAASTELRKDIAEVRITSRETAAATASSVASASYSARAGSCDTKEHQRLADELRKDLEVRMEQMQLASQRLAEDLRAEMEARLSQTGASMQRLTEEWRRERQRWGDEAKDLRHSIESGSASAATSVTQAGATAQALARQLTEELRQELEARTSQTQGALQRSISELRFELETQAGQVQHCLQRFTNETRDALKDTQSLRVSFDGARTFAEETRRQVSDLRATQEVLSAAAAANGNASSSSSASLVAAARTAAREAAREEVLSTAAMNSGSASSNSTTNLLAAATAAAREAAREEVLSVAAVHSVSGGTTASISVAGARAAGKEAAEHAVDALREELEESMGQRLRRCDVAAAGCERCVEEVLARALAMEEQLRGFERELRGYLEEESSKLIQLLAAIPRQPSPEFVSTASTPRHDGIGVAGAATPATTPHRGRGSDARAPTAVDGRPPVGNTSLQATVDAVLNEAITASPMASRILTPTPHASPAAVSGAVLGNGGAGTSWQVEGTETPRGGNAGRGAVPLIGPHQPIAPDPEAIVTASGPSSTAARTMAPVAATSGAGPTTVQGASGRGAGPLPQAVPQVSGSGATPLRTTPPKPPQVVASSLHSFAQPPPLPQCEGVSPAAGIDAAVQAEAGPMRGVEASALPQAGPMIGAEAAVQVEDTSLQERHEDERRRLQDELAVAVDSLARAKEELRRSQAQSAAQVEGLIRAQEDRVCSQERAVEELRRQCNELKCEVDGYLIERKVTRSLAGLELGQRGGGWHDGVET